MINQACDITKVRQRHRPSSLQPPSSIDCKIKTKALYLSLADLSPVDCLRWRSKKGTDPFLGNPGACALNAGDDTLRDICLSPCVADPFSLCNRDIAQIVEGNR